MINALLHSNTTGHTLVLEDDHEVKVTALQALISEVPSDWDIIRFDCKKPLPPFVKYITPQVSTYTRTYTQLHTCHTHYTRT